jgi:hypothetical protein
MEEPQVLKKSNEGSLAMQERLLEELEDHYLR